MKKICFWILLGTVLGIPFAGYSALTDGLMVHYPFNNNRYLTGAEASPFIWLGGRSRCLHRRTTHRSGSAGRAGLGLRFDRPRC